MNGLIAWGDTHTHKHAHTQTHTHTNVRTKKPGDNHGIDDNIPYSGLISMKKFSNKYTKFMPQRIYFRTPDLNCRVLLLHINFGGIYFRRETAKQNVRK